MYNFFAQACFSYRGLYGWHNVPGYINNLLLMPVASIILYSVLGRFAIDPEAAQYYALGVAVHAMPFILIGGILQTYSYDKEMGTAAFMYVSPVNRFLYFLSRPVCFYPNALVAFTIALTTVWLVVDVDFGLVNWAGFILAVLVTAASLAAFAQFISIFTIVTRDWMNAMALTVGIILVLTGIIIPITVFPPVVQEFSRILPLTNGLSVIRATFAGAPLAEVYLTILREALTALVYFTIGFIGFTLFERVAKRIGTLEAEAQ
jgi:ABC-2 type transport system permease protein